MHIPGSQKSTSSKGSYGSTDSDYFYAAPPPPDVKDSGPIKWKHLDIIKEGDNHNTSDWSDTGMGLEVIQLDKVRFSIDYSRNNMTRMVTYYSRMNV